MDEILLVTRLVLAAVFALAGVTKLADLAGSRTAMRKFGLPARVAGIAGTALPIVELAVAVLLLPRATAWWAALGALALLLSFIAGIAWNMKQGRAPECHCFGQVHSEPVGWPTLARNGALALLAVLILAPGPDDPGASLTGGWGDRSGGEQAGIALAAMALALGAGLAWLVYHLLQQNGRILRRLDALEATLAASGSPAATPTTGGSSLAIGAPAPPFRLPALAGGEVSLDDLRRAGKPVLLLFSDPLCGPCTTLLSEVAQWQEEHAAGLTIAVIGRGNAGPNRDKVGDLTLTNVLHGKGGDVATAYGVRGTPGAVLVHPNGTIASEPALGAERIRSLLTIATTQPLPARPTPNGTGSAPARPAAIPVGTPAPDVTLPDLDGATVSLGDFRGQPALLLFWNPGCGFCRRMLDDLKAWETDPPADAPRLLVVSTGPVKENRAQELRSPVLLDQGFTTGRRFGASGTPSAVLVDAGGNVASAVAVGQDAVMSLAGSRVFVAP